MERHNQIKKYTKADLEELYQHLKKEFEMMDRKRRDGDESYIDFTAFD
jgi:hypothetical protein